MGLNVIRYYLRETFQSLIRNGLLSVASTIAVFLSLFILGSSLLLALNMDRIASKLESKLEITVFLENKADFQIISDLQKRLRLLPEVSSFEFIPKDKALEEMKKNLGDKQEILAGLEKKNPLPDTFRIKVKQSKQIPVLANRIKSWPGVEGIRYGQGWVEKMLNITRLVRLAGVIGIIILGVIAVFLISVTIRISVFTRRQEIGIMKFLGATNWFVRLPFLLEGMTLGILGSLVAVLVINFSYFSLMSNLKIPIFFIQPITEKELLLPVFWGLLILGALIGALGSIISIQRFLKV